MIEIIPFNPNFSASLIGVAVCSLSEAKERKELCYLSDWLNQYPTEKQSSIVENRYVGILYIYQVCDSKPENSVILNHFLVKFRLSIDRFRDKYVKLLDPSYWNVSRFSFLWLK